MEKEKEIMPGEKLLNPANYGPEEYFVIFLGAFILFVAVKHAIFHTFYFWWFQYGRFYIPDKFWTLVTGKTLPQRVLQFVRNKLENNKTISLEKLKVVVNEYFETKEFAPSLGVRKGKIVNEIVSKYKPNTSLVVGCHVGYVLLEILEALPDNGNIIVIESDAKFISTAKALLEIAELEKRVTFLCGNAIDVIPGLKSNYNISKFDFVFLNRTKHDMGSHVPLLKTMEKNEYFHLNPKRESGEGENRTVILADKVVMLGDPEFLKYVRLSDNYETKYHQMALEHSSDEIVDGMEMAIYQG